MNIVVVLLFSCGIFIVPSACALFFRATPKIAKNVGPVSTILGSILGIVVVVVALCNPALPRTFSIATALPLLDMCFNLDNLSIWFLLPLFWLSGSCTIYGMGYCNQLSSKRSVFHWLLWNGLVVSMVGILIAAHALVFLLAWELMAITSGLLIFAHHENQKTRFGAWVYLLSTHVSAIFVLILIVSLGNDAHSFFFSDMVGSPEKSSLLFMCALIGFGVKAGFFPFHVWIPKTYPAAPTHVTALMSGITIKMGLFGLLRFIPLCGVLPEWFGFALLCIGAVSTLYGILSASGQTNILKILAFSSVENIGIITLGLGLGYIGQWYGNVALATLGYCAALIHIVNHSCIKSLLFLAGGTIVSLYKTSNIEEMGGLFKRCGPLGWLFCCGALAIIGFPPLNGFISESILIFATYTGLFAHPDSVSLSSTLLLCIIAIASGVAALSFARAFGCIFLGEPRSAQCSQVKTVSLPLQSGMIVLALGCCLLVAIAPFSIGLLLRVVQDTMLWEMSPELVATKNSLQTFVTALSLGCAGFGVLFLAFFFVRKNAYRNKVTGQGLTWDCGYGTPTQRMQYTATSFSKEIILLGRHLLFLQVKKTPVSGHFPTQSSWHQKIPESLFSRVYTPLVKNSARMLSKLKWIQDGRMHMYILYIALTLVALFIWSFA